MSDPLAQLQSEVSPWFSLERELGGGGMSRVFVATERALGRSVVLKVLPPNLGIDLSAERFTREIMLAAGLQHPCIVPVLFAGVAAGIPYYTMPFVEGPTLRTRLEERKRLPIDEAVGILRDVASALAHAHARGIVHRDIKPENILLSGGYAQVTDFGIARAISDSRTPEHGARGRVTQAGLAIGTPAYMAPEQATGDVAMDQRVDVYALGCLAFELFTGAPPFTGRSPHLTLNAQISEAPPDVRAKRNDLPPNLAALVMRCLEKDPAKRPQSADEILEYLKAPRAAARPAPSPRESGTRSHVWRYLAVSLVIAGVGVGIFALRPRSSPAKSVAVLPFANLGGDTTQEYFSDGLTDDLISALADIPGIRIASRASAFALKGKPVDARDVGKRLDVADLLEGSVRRTGSSVRVNAMLVRTTDGVSTWSRTFDRPAADIFAVQDDITRAIARELRLKLHSGADSLGRAHTPSAAAHELYLHGEARAEVPTEASLRDAIDFFKKAVVVDSAYAQAWAAIATTYARLADIAAMQPADVTEATAAARRALSLDPSGSGAHAVLGMDLLELNDDWPAAKRELDAALQRDSTSADVHAGLAVYELAMHQPQRAVTESRRALALDPLSVARSNLVERMWLAAREPDSAIAQHARTQELERGFVLHDSWLGEAYRQKGMNREALAEYERVAKQLGRPTPGYAIALAASGRATEAKRVLAELESKWPRPYVPPELIAGAHARLGDLEAAVAWLERGAAARSGMLAGDGVDYDLEPLRGNARYEALLAKLGIRAAR